MQKIIMWVNAKIWYSGTNFKNVFSTRTYFNDERCTMATSSSNADSTDEQITDPGAAPFGNFINYYTFNPPENRLSLIPATLLQDLGYDRDTTLILDVGCNSGVCMKYRLILVSFEVKFEKCFSGKSKHFLFDL